MEIWPSIYSELSKSTDSQLNSAILGKIEFREILNDDTIVLCAPDEFTKGWFSENFLHSAQVISKTLFEKNYQFRIEVVNEKSFTEVKERGKKAQKPSIYSMNLNPKYTFEHYVVGNSNDFAHAAALNVAKFPGGSYNPLFIYGNVALGKTHLLQAIAHRILGEKPDLKILYITSEAFTNEFVEAVRDDKQSSRSRFREKYRNIDVLLMDDIQFLQNKASTLSELFHTFNELFHDRKQMVFACDQPPKSLQAIEERLRTRFDSGLTVEIKIPDYETRKAILLEKAKDDNIEIPDNVVDYISEHIDSDIRTLEGSLTKVIAYSSLKKKQISLDLTKDILRDKIKIEAPKNLTITDIQKVVSKFFGVSINDLKSPKRMESITYPRQIAMYLATEYTSLSLTEIGQFFGGKAHTTVMRSSQKIGGLLKSRKKVKREIEDIISQFYNSARR
jgi:chromosomal replication initiator protein